MLLRNIDSIQVTNTKFRIRSHVRECWLANRSSWITDVGNFVISLTYIQSLSFGTLGCRKLICFTVRLTNTVWLDFHCSFACLPIFVQVRRRVYFQCKSPVTKCSFSLTCFNFFFKLGSIFSKYLFHSCTKQTNMYFNLLKPNDIYICRTAALTSRRYILNIYSTNIHTEYFKHAA